MKTDEGLIRAVGVRGLSAAIINYTVGAGIFVLPAVVAGMVGNAAPVIYLVCAVAMTLIVICFAEAGSRVSLSGGTYAYAEIAFGPYIGFMVAMCLWFGTNVLASAAVANVCVDTLAQIFPLFAKPAARTAFLLAMYALFAAINIRGVKAGSRTVQTVTAAKLIPLLVLVTVGFFAVKGSNLSWPGMPAAGDVARTSVMLMFAFLGVESALTPSGEVRDPARTVPRAVFIGLVVVTLLYISIQIVSQGVLGADLAANTQAPLAEAARRAIGSAGWILMLAGAAISTFGYVAGDVLASPRTIYALGRDGLLPSFTSRIHDRFRTPHVAILIHVVLCAGFAVTGSFTALVVLSVLATLIVYLICCLATIQLQRRDVRADGSVPFSVPGGPVIPLLASAMVIWLMSSSTRQEFIAIGVAIAVLTLIYILMRARRTPVPTAS
ncbi:MAG: amino acid permease [Gemmatimonadaceae bacterium]|nr:amino acid permease [Gemmatimonadaceae bacterium]